MNALPVILGQDLNLPSPPAIAIRIIEEIKKEESSMEALARIISMDPALVSKILRVANSPFYRTVSEVDNLQRALSIIGNEAVKNIALSFVLVTHMSVAHMDGFDVDRFWRRSVTTAVGAEMLGEAMGTRSDDIFISGLLQDIGSLLMFQHRPGDYGRALDEERAGGRPMVTVEREIFGFDHQTLGAEVLRAWGLPESICGPVGFHHNAASAPEAHAPRARVLHLSDALSTVYHGFGCTDSLQAVKAALSENPELNPDRVDALVDGVAGKTVGMLSFFDLDPGDMKPFSQILQDANTELRKLNLSYEQLVIELKRAKQQAEALALELKTANGKLRELAIRDPLTGLFNRRHFSELMERETAKASRYDRPLSVVMIDLDHFKRINDTYGHTFGDEVLRVVSAKLSSVVRSSDIPARFGGEEFVILLPETGLEGAMTLAQRVRVGIERITFQSGTRTVNVTASLGVAARGAGSGAGTGRGLSLIEAADKALYHSKANGRNRVSAARASESGQAE